jgi:hypothetical protein
VRPAGAFFGLVRLQAPIGRASEDRAVGNPRLRRTVFTGMNELGVAPWVVKTVLNHVRGSKGGVAGRYNYSRLPAEKAPALARWAEHCDLRPPRSGLLRRPGYFPTTTRSASRMLSANSVLHSRSLLRPVGVADRAARPQPPGAGAEGQDHRTIVADHLRLVQASDRYRGNATAELTETSGALKTLAKELDVPVRTSCPLPKISGPAKNLDRAISAMRNSRGLLRFRRNGPACLMVVCSEGQRGGTGDRTLEALRATRGGRELLPFRQWRLSQAVSPRIDSFTAFAARPAFAISRLGEVPARRTILPSWYPGSARGRCVHLRSLGRPLLAGRCRCTHKPVLPRNAYAKAPEKICAAWRWHAILAARVKPIARPRRQASPIPRGT